MWFDYGVLEKKKKEKRESWRRVLKRECEVDEMKMSVIGGREAAAFTWFWWIF